MGDSPLVGCGGYADSSVGAVSTTGHGESITKVCLARTVLHHLESGKDPQEAGAASLSYMYRKVSGSRRKSSYGSLDLLSLFWF